MIRLLFLLVDDLHSSKEFTKSVTAKAPGWELFYSIDNFSITFIQIVDIFGHVVFYQPITKANKQIYVDVQSGDEIRVYSNILSSLAHHRLLFLFFFAILR